MNAKSLSPSQGGKLFEVDRMSAGAALREVGNWLPTSRATVGKEPSVATCSQIR